MADITLFEETRKSGQFGYGFFINSTFSKFNFAAESMREMRDRQVDNPMIYGYFYIS